MRMNTNDIAYFLDVAETQHMTKSARRLHVAQPAISRSIARLETELGVKLFEREGRGIKLTPEGRLLKSKLSLVQQELRDVDKTFADLREGRQSEVLISLGAGSHVVSDVLGRWMVENPAVRIRLTQMGDASAADIVVAAEPVRACAVQRSYTERVMLAAPSSMQMDDPVALADLQACSFVSLPSKAGFSRFVADMCAREKFRPNVALESDNPSVVRKIIGMGLGVGFWPEKSWGALAGEGIRMHKLANGASRTIYAALSEAGAKNAAAKECYRYLCDELVTVFEQ